MNILDDCVFYGLKFKRVTLEDFIGLLVEAEESGLLTSKWALLKGIWLYLNKDPQNRVLVFPAESTNPVALYTEFDCYAIVETKSDAQLDRFYKNMETRLTNALSQPGKGAGYSMSACEIYINDEKKALFYLQITDHNEASKLIAPIVANIFRKVLNES